MFVYVLFVLPAVFLSLWASARVKSVFQKYSRCAVASGMTGYEVARVILDKYGLDDVRVETASGGFLSDHYDASARVLRLSAKVAQESSVASVGVAAHEAGHAVQDAVSYAPLVMRQWLVPVTQLSSWVFNVLIFLAVFAAGLFHAYGLLELALICLAVTVLFSLVTLPVEFDASARAKDLLVECAVVDQGELYGVARVLNAAALTYVAAAAAALMTFLYYLLSFVAADE